jgi:hypothetical protein
LDWETFWHNLTHRRFVEFSVEEVVQALKPAHSKKGACDVATKALCLTLLHLFVTYQWVFSVTSLNWILHPLLKAAGADRRAVAQFLTRLTDGSRVDVRALVENGLGQGFAGVSHSR